MLAITDLWAGYHGQVVLRGVSLEVRAGELVALVGPNGAGKSTLLRAISGVVPIRRGQVRLGGQDAARLSPQARARRIAVVPQAVSLPGAFTVAEIVLMGRTPHLGWLGQEGRDDYAAARAAMERTCTTELAARRIGEISGGEQQRVLIARALAQSAPTLLMDEPTAHLDLKHQVSTLSLVQRLAHEAGYAVIAALHDLNLAADFADRIALLAQGELRAFGSPAEVLTPEHLAPAYGLPVHVITHPAHGTPLVLPDGVDRAGTRRASVPA